MHQSISFEEDDINYCYYQRNILDFDSYRLVERREGRAIPEHVLYVEFLIYRFICKIFYLLGLPYAF